MVSFWLVIPAGGFLARAVSPRIQYDMRLKGGRNIRKLTVLQALTLEPGWVSAGSLRVKHLITTMTLRNLQMALLRYCRWGLVERKPSGYSRKFLYRISAKGQLRLKWLRTHAIEESRKISGIPA